MNNLMRSVSNFVNPQPAKTILPTIPTENVELASPPVATTVLARQPVTTQIEVRGHVQNIEPASFVVSQNILDVIGRDNENIRNKCSDVVRKVEEAASLHRDLGTIFSQIDTILADLEATKSDLIQRTTSLAAERDAHALVKLAHRETTEAFERLKADAATVAAEHKRHVQALAEMEITLGSLQLAHAAKVGQHADMLRQNAGDADRIQELSREVQSIGSELQRADALIVALQADGAAQRDRAVLAEEDAASLQSALSETRQLGAKLGRSLEEASAGQDAARRQVAELEGALAAEKAEHVKYRTLWQQESDGRRADAVAAQIKIEAQVSRIEASDRLLAAARNQFHAKVEELRKEERRSQEFAANAATLDHKARLLETQNGELRSKLSEVEKSRDAALERATQQLKAIMAKENAIQQGERKMQMISDRAGADNQRFDSQRDQYEQRIQKISEQLEKEKLERALAQGALDVARKDRSRSPALAQALEDSGEKLALAATGADAVDFGSFDAASGEKAPAVVHADGSKRQRNGAGRELTH